MKINLDKVYIIIENEYCKGIKNKSFIVLTLLVPFLLYFMYSAESIAKNISEYEEKIILVSNDIFLTDTLTPYKTLSFEYSNEPIDSLKKKVKDRAYWGLLIVNKDSKERENLSVKIYSHKMLTLNEIDYLHREFERLLYNYRLESLHINIEEFKKATILDLKIEEINIENNGANSAFFPSAIAYISIILLYLCIFQFSGLIMKNISYEKNNKVIELILSSVNTYELMIGKIIGSALLGITQFLLWIILFMIIFFIGMNDFNINSELLNQAYTFNSNMFYYLIIFFLYFVGGYFLYASLFAAIGALINQNTDAQQFVLPVTIPLIATFIISTQEIGNKTLLIQILSQFPLTSPVAMLSMVPFGTVSIYELLTSLVLLYLFILLTIYFVSKIFREGIIINNSKIEYKDILKWVRQNKKNIHE